MVAPWHDSLRVSTSGWPDGFYLFRLTDSRGWQAEIPYVVRSPVLTGRLVLSAPVATWQAYNDWGGYDLYQGRAMDRRAWAVSLDRPYPAPGAGDMVFGVVPVAVEAEKAGVPLAFVTDLDLAADPHALRGAAAFVSLGHDEYWSAEMRGAVAVARDHGTNLAFLGANTMYWQIRLAQHTARGYRQVIGYRTDAQLDPWTSRNPHHASGLLRDIDPHGAEETLTGMRYECFPVDAAFRIASPDWWGFHGTGVRKGTSFAHLVGVEADRVYPLDTTPRPLQVLAHSTYDCDGAPTSTEATYYTTRSGAAVFDAGTLRWTCALRGHCHPYTLPRSTTHFVQRVTRNVLRTFAKGPAGLRRPAVDNISRFDLPTINEVPAS